MPFTANRDFKKDPRMVVAADGMYYKSETGQDILDSAAGLWCVNAGHNRPEITSAISEQAATLDFAQVFNMVIQNLLNLQVVSLIYFQKV